MWRSVTVSFVNLKTTNAAIGSRLALDWCIVGHRPSSLAAGIASINHAFHGRMARPFAPSAALRIETEGCRRAPAMRLKEVLWKCLNNGRFAVQRERQF